MHLRRDAAFINTPRLYHTSLLSHGSPEYATLTCVLRHVSATHTRQHATYPLNRSQVTTGGRCATGYTLVVVLTMLDACLFIDVDTADTPLLPQHAIATPLMAVPMFHTVITVTCTPHTPQHFVTTPPVSAPFLGYRRHAIRHAAMSVQLVTPLRVYCFI